MKQTNNKPAILKAVFFTVIFSVFISAAFAGNDANKDSGKTNTTATVVYLGTLNAQPLFQVDIDQHENRDAVLVIMDKYGVELYEEILNVSSYKKRFQLDHDVNLNDVQVHIFYGRGKQKQLQVFEMSSTSLQLDNVAVARIK